VVRAGEGPLLVGDLGLVDLVEDRGVELDHLGVLDPLQVEVIEDLLLLLGEDGLRRILANPVERGPAVIEGDRRIADGGLVGQRSGRGDRRARRDRLAEVAGERNRRGLRGLRCGGGDKGGGRQQPQSDERPGETQRYSTHGRVTGVGGRVVASCATLTRPRSTGGGRTSCRKDSAGLFAGCNGWAR
jgi:hypothetical protein